MRTFWMRFRSLFLRRKLDAELSDEVRFHLEMLEDEALQRGLDPHAARLAAQREFGGVDQLTETYREHRGIAAFEIFWKDVVHAARGLLRSPSFTAAAVLSLALGIGANTAIFSFINMLMLRMLPVSHPEQLVTLYRVGGWGRGYGSYPLYLRVRERHDAFSGVVARSGAGPERFRTGALARSEAASTEFVSGNYFSVLGVTPALGRLFYDSDNVTPHAHPVAVLSYDFWERRFGLDPAVLGRAVRVGDNMFTIVGVARQGFSGVAIDQRPDIWIPAMMTSAKIEEAGNHWVWILARRRPGVSMARVQTTANDVMRRYLAEFYGNTPNPAFRQFAMEQRLEVRDARAGLSSLRDKFGKPLNVLMAAVGLVLLVACVNVANLMLARGVARRREIALRLALGASRGRVIRQLMIESVLLGGMGCLLGLALARVGVRALLLFLPHSAGVRMEVSPDATVLAFAAGVSLAAVAFFGLLPACRVTNLDLGSSLKTGVAPGAGRHSRYGGRNLLVAAQVALSVVLVAVAGLFARSLSELRSIDLGFHERNVLTFMLNSPQSWKPEERTHFRLRLVEQLGSLPGVTSVSYGMPGPYQGGMSSTGLRVPGSARTANEPAMVAMQSVGPHFFSTIGSPLLSGREFETVGASPGRKTAIVNQAFARVYFPGVADPTGRVISFDTSKPDGGEPTYIAGLARDILHDGLRAKVEPTVYVPTAQAPGMSLDPWILVRPRVNPSTLWPLVRHAVAEASPDVMIDDPRTIRERIDDSIFLERMVAWVSGFFGLLALTLAGVGLYGVLSYNVALRTGEIGVRVALGSTQGRIVRMVLRDGLALVGVGIAAGLPLSLASGRIVSSLLYGVRGADATTFAATVVVLVSAGAAAALLPARRASVIDPMTALRRE